MSGRLTSENRKFEFIVALSPHPLCKIAKIAIIDAQKDIITRSRKLTNLVGHLSQRDNFLLLHAHLFSRFRAEFKQLSLRSLSSISNTACGVGSVLSDAAQRTQGFVTLPVGY